MPGCSLGAPTSFTAAAYRRGVLQMFRLPDHTSACLAARGLQRHGLTARAGVRDDLAFLAVRSDRPDVADLVAGLAPDAVRVGGERTRRRPRPDAAA